jgi:hypothetical protein
MGGGAAGWPSEHLHSITVSARQGRCATHSSPSAAAPVLSLLQYSPFPLQSHTTYSLCCGLTGYHPRSFCNLTRRQPTQAAGWSLSSRCSLRCCHWSEGCCAVGGLLCRGPIQRHRRGQKKDCNLSSAAPPVLRIAGSTQLSWHGSYFLYTLWVRASHPWLPLL